MVTYTAATAGAGKQARAVGWAGTLKTAIGIYEVDVIHVLGDTIEMVKLPKGAVIVGGWLRGDKSISHCMAVSVFSTAQSCNETSNAILREVSDSANRSPKGRAASPYVAAARRFGIMPTS
jgi:hypothetical protein